jgi:thiosulfate/3-mercaptopyruvate sulfurtransferase
VDLRAPQPPPGPGTSIPPFVDVACVRSWMGEVVLADTRWYLDGRSGGAAYDAGHLSGAVFVDLDEALAGPPSPAAGRHPLPTPEAFAAALARVGIADDDTVVAYDDAGGTVAARLVWLLRAIGRPAAVLDGGIAAWEEPLDREEPTRPPTRRTPVPWPAELLASIDDAADPFHVVVDARERPRYLGLEEPVDPRAGHIPGARSLPAREHLDAGGRLRPRAELRRRLTGVGITDPGTPVVSYCGSGVTACHTLLVLEHVGLGRGRLYPGSWSQWSSDPARPAATGG